MKKPEKKETHFNCNVVIEAGKPTYCETCKREVKVSDEWYANSLYNQAIDDYEKFQPTWDEITEILVDTYTKSNFNLPCRGLFKVQAVAIRARLRGDE